jgi:hypothetical protein
MKSYFGKCNIILNSTYDWWSNVEKNNKKFFIYPKIRMLTDIKITKNSTPNEWIKI